MQAFKNLLLVILILAVIAGIGFVGYGIYKKLLIAIPRQKSQSAPSDKQELRQVKEPY